MGSFIQIDSISIDLANSIDKSDAGKCDHFSIRGYVSEIRKKDWKICWPFPLQGNHGESKDQPSSLPPLDVPKFRWWCCQSCRQEIAAEGIDKDDQTEFNCCSTGCRSATNCCGKAALRSDIQLQLPPTSDTLERREIDLNSSTNLSYGNDCLPTNNEKEKKADVANSRIIDHETGLEDNLSRQITSVPPAEVYPWLMLEAPTNDRVFQGNEVSDVEVATGNLKCVDQNSPEICNGGKHISADDQCHKELNKTCTILGEGTIVALANHTTDHTVGHPPMESVACPKALPGITENLFENDIQDHHLEKSSDLPRRRPRKVRLLTDLLSKHVETKTEKFTIQGFPSNGTSNATPALQTPTMSQGKVDVQGDFTDMSKSRKNKFLLDEEQKPAEMCSHRVDSEVQNLEGDAEVNDTILDTGSKDVHLETGLQDVVKSCWSKPETERSHATGKRKNKKIRVVDNHLRSYPYQNEENMDIVNKAYASKTLSSRLASCTFTEKGMDTFPVHALRTEKECNSSKRKGKMLQVDGELASLSCWKNDMLVEDSFALTGAKVMANMPVVVPIPSAQGSTLNEKGGEERLHLSLNSYLAAQVCTKKCIHQIENQPPFSLSLQEGTSKVHQLIRKDREINVVGEHSIPCKHMTDAISEKGVPCEVSSNKNPLRMLFHNGKYKYTSQVEDGIHFHDQQMKNTGARNTEKTAEALEQAGIMKNNGDQTADKVSELGTVDDIPMEIVELMAKNQYERRLSDAENRSHQPENSTIRRKAQKTVGTTVYGKGELSLLKEGQKVKPEGRHGKNGMAVRGENLRPGKRKSIHYCSPIDGTHMNMNSFCEPQSSFGFEFTYSQKKSSNGFNFSPMAASELGSAQNFKLNGSTAENESSDSTLQLRGGCSLHKTILHQDDKASRSWASLTSNHLSLGYDIPKKVVSHSPSTIMDMTSLRSGTLHKQNMNRDIDFNYLNLNATGLEKLNRNMGPGNFGGMNAEYPFPCKHNGIEPHQNMRGSLDLYSNDTIPAMHLLSLMDAGMKSGKSINASVSAHMLNKPSYSGDCNSKLEISTSKVLGSLKRPSSDYYNKNCISDKSHGCFLSSPTLAASSSIQHNEKFIKATNFNSQMSAKSGKKEKMKNSNSAIQNKGNEQFSWPCVQTETPLQQKLEIHGTCETLVPSKHSCVSNSCSINRNPADFTMPEIGNLYMIRGEDLKFDKASIPKKRPSLFTLQGCKQQRNLKRSKIKEHAKH